MEALTLLRERRSVAKLAAPAPDGAALENILYAGLRAPDHGGLKPWRFYVIKDSGLERLSQLFQEVLTEEGATDEEISKVAKAPFRAPMIIAVIAACKEHPKVPIWEQLVSAGCAVQAMQMAAVAQGFGGIWRTGSWTNKGKVKKAFTCVENEQIVGFLYLGTPTIVPHAIHTTDLTHYVNYF